MLSSKADKYPFAGGAPDGRGGVYFPDAVIDALAGAVPKATPLAGQGPQQGEGPPVIALPQAEALVLGALLQFDPALGEKAAAVLNDADRCKFREVEPGKVSRQWVQPAGSPDADGGIADKAVIHYDHDGTINGVIYLAHELGHALADDFQNEAGYNFTTNPVHMEETQAYFLQHIAYNYLKAHPDPEISAAARQNFRRETALYAEDLQLSLAAADTLKGGGHEDQALKALEEAAGRVHYRPTSFLLTAGIVGRLENFPPESRRQISEILLGGHGPKGIADILARVGVERAQDMGAFANEIVEVAFSQSAEPERAPGRENKNPAVAGF